MRWVGKVTRRRERRERIGYNALRRLWRTAWGKGRSVRWQRYDDKRRRLTAIALHWKHPETYYWDNVRALNSEAGMRADLATLALDPKTAAPRP